MKIPWPDGEREIIARMRRRSIELPADAFERITDTEARWRFFVGVVRVAAVCDPEAMRWCRKARADLPKILDKFGLQAAELAASLQEVRRAVWEAGHYAGELRLPYDLRDLMKREPPDGWWYARPPVVPHEANSDLVHLLEWLATISAKDAERIASSSDVTRSATDAAVSHSRQASPRDFERALTEALSSIAPAGFRLTEPELRTLADVCLDLSPR